MNKPDLRRFEDEAALSNKVAALWLEELAALTAPGARCLTALSGGRIARRFFEDVARLARSGGHSLEPVEFFWADERCVPPTDEESNFALAEKNLFEPLNIPLARTHRIRGEIPPESAAADAEAELIRLAPSNAEGQPVLDFVFLGMGEDGHIASLFPNEPDELAQSKRTYRVVVGPKPPPRRITLNYAPLIAAKNVWVLASGPGKQPALNRSLGDEPDTPLGRLLLKRERTRIFTDLEV